MHFAPQQDQRTRAIHYSQEKDLQKRAAYLRRVAQLRPFSLQPVVSYDASHGPRPTPFLFYIGWSSTCGACSTTGHLAYMARPFFRHMDARTSIHLRWLSPNGSPSLDRGVDQVCALASVAVAEVLRHT